MSEEEEKKAIEFIEDKMTESYESTKWEDGEDIQLPTIEWNYYYLILRIIEKQKKEIKRLKGIEEDYIRRMRTSNKVLLKQGYVSIEKYNKLLEKYDKGINKLMNIKLYACDINKNKECEKKHCYINGGECDATTDKTKVKYVNLYDYIPKEAVKEKIKEIEDSLKENCIALHEFQRLAKIDILKEILGDE